MAVAPIRLRYVSGRKECEGRRGHYVCGTIHKAPPKVMPRGARQFSRANGLIGEADHAIVATCGGRLVGFFRYDVFSNTLYACGTWVAPKMRRKGLGERLWRAALRRQVRLHSRLPPLRCVEVSTISRGGYALIQKVERTAPAGVTFLHHRC